MVKLSVCICTYRRPDLLDRVLRSVVPQLREGREIVVVNDGSHDAEYAAVVERHGQAIRYQASDTNMGVAEARNTSAKLAAGEHVVYLDDDCVAPGAWLDWLEARLETWPELDIVAGTTNPLTPQGGHSFQSLMQSHFGFIPKIFFQSNLVIFPTANVAIRRELILRLGGFGYPGSFFGAGEDTEFAVRAQLAGARVFADQNWQVSHEVGEPFTALLRRYRRYGFANGAILPLTSSPPWHDYIRGLRMPLRRQFNHYRQTVRHEARSWPGPAWQLPFAMFGAIVVHMAYEHAALQGWRKHRSN